MAKMIVVAETRFDELFEKTLATLELSQFVTPHIARSPEHVRITEDMWRRFHYEVCVLKSALTKD